MYKLRPALLLVHIRDFRENKINRFTKVAVVVPNVLFHLDQNTTELESRIGLKQAGKEGKH